MIYVPWEENDEFFMYTELLVTDEMDLVTILERTHHDITTNQPCPYDLEIGALIIEMAKHSPQRSLHADAIIKVGGFEMIGHD